MALYWSFLLPSFVCLAFTCFNQCFLNFNLFDSASIQRMQDRVRQGSYTMKPTDAEQDLTAAGQIAQDYRAEIDGASSCGRNEVTLGLNLSMADMKKLERADVIALNGAGLEEFLEDALATSDAAVIDCSMGVELLENLSHHHDEDGEDGHDHGHWDPHYWMDPENARIMAANLGAGLEHIDPDTGSGTAQTHQVWIGRCTAVERTPRLSWRVTAACWTPI